MVCCFKERLHCLFLFTQLGVVWAHDPYQVKMSTGLFLAYLSYGLATSAIVFGSILHFHRLSKLLKMCLKRD